MGVGRESEGNLPLLSLLLSSASPFPLPPLHSPFCALFLNAWNRLVVIFSQQECNYDIEAKIKCC